MKIQIKTFNVISESFRYGDSNNVEITRFSRPELRDEYLKYITKGYRDNEHLHEYEPNCFEDESHKWAYEFKINDETIEISDEQDW